MKINFKDEALLINNELVKMRRDFHEHPELGFEEYRTSKIIKDFLKNENIPYLEVAKTGVCAIIKGMKKEEDKEEKCIALRADIDGLPMVDKKVCSYSSKEKGKMHGCGHDAHTTILLGVAKILNKHKDSFSGCVKLFFEPAEETTGGAPLMINEGY